MDYPGKVITKNQVTPTQISATGVWTLDDAAAATRNNNWPVAGVPNPISKSLRFNSADTAYLNRTPASAGNRRTFTFNQWIKRAELGTRQVLFSAGTGANAGHEIEFQSDNTLAIYSNAPGASVALATTQVFRDPSAWGMLTFAFDTTQATDTNRIKVYWNGTQITAFSSASYPAQNADLEFNNNVPHNIGRREIGTTLYCGLYMTEINFIDGQQLTPSSFGMTDPVTGVWEPLKYSGTYGTNGFYLNFKDATSTTTLGLDYSGNANNWTTNNFSVTAGSGNDSLTDVPTPWIVYNTTGDVGGVVRGNYATLNPIEAPSASVISNGNLQVVLAATGTSQTPSTIGVTSGKWYSEFTFSATASGNAVAVGVGPAETYQANIFSVGVSYFAFDGTKYVSGVNTSYGATWTTGDIIGIALDVDGGTITFYKNNTSQGAITLPASASGWKFVTQNGGGSSTKTFDCNFGQRPFSYTPPSGFLSLCTTNLPASTVLKGGDYFNPVLYTGNASSNAITGVGFAPDWIWIKSRSNGALNHALFDVLRGTPRLDTSTTVAEGEFNQLNTYDTDGFTLKNELTVNQSGGSYVAWNWNAGGSTVTNTAGTISSQVRANTTSGFSIVTYTGTGTNGATVGHGLGVVPDMIIVKRRNSTGQWATYHRSIGNTGALRLNATSATITDVSFWNNTSPTSTVFTIGVDGDVNTNTGTYVAYCFDSISGFSAFGSYTGNGSADGPFVYLGFRPRWVLIKNASAATWNWFLWDTSRDTYNAAGSVLLPNASDAELTNRPIDILSNGFKIRATDTHTNGSGNTMIYAAFAENPFKNALAR